MPVMQLEMLRGLGIARPTLGDDRHKRLTLTGQTLPDRGLHLMTAARPTIQQPSGHTFELEVPAAPPNPSRGPQTRCP